MGRGQDETVSNGTVSSGGCRRKGCRNGGPCRQSIPGLPKRLQGDQWPYGFLAEELNGANVTENQRPEPQICRC